MQILENLIPGTCMELRFVSPAHYFFVQTDREHRDTVSVLTCSPQKEKTDQEKYNRIRTTLDGRRLSMAHKGRFLATSSPRCSCLVSHCSNGVKNKLTTSWTTQRATMCLVGNLCPRLQRGRTMDATPSAMRNSKIGRLAIILTGAKTIGTASTIETRRILSAISSLPCMRCDKDILF